jgi:hypothetical protein
MIKLLATSVYFLLVIQQVMSGPISGATCCAGCCGALAAVPGLGLVAAGTCLPLCLGTLGAMPPQCTLCAAMFLAPTP